MSETLPSERFPALGSTAVVVCAVPEGLAPAVEAVGAVLDEISVSCSRFRSDSEITRANAARGEWTPVSRLFVEALTAALDAARETDGLVDPTVGEALMRIGYDRDFASVPPMGPSVSSAPAPGWGSVDLDVDRQRVRLRPGVRIDLGATAKAFAADRAVGRAAAHAGCGVMVALGGDVATAGASPPGGWRIGFADDHADDTGSEPVSIRGGGLATSSTMVRRWSRGGRTMHHIVDPRTGMPAAEVWRTVSVVAASCLGANTASTASMILGAGALAWLERRHLPARLVDADGAIVRVGGWPLERAA
jgi:thiamine biosynthesis lipoprotein